MTYTAYGLTAAAAGLTGLAYMQGQAAQQRLNGLQSQSETIPLSQWQPDYGELPELAGREPGQHVCDGRSSF